MNTEVIKVNPGTSESDKIQRVAEIIKAGGLVGFPTETVYGLAANALDEEAIKKVFEVKGRPMNNPLPVQIFSIQQVDRLVDDISESANRLMEHFFPGPLTIVLRASSSISEIITSGTGKIGIRMPNHPVALALLSACETPIVAPSANPFGKPPPTSADEVLAYFNGKIDAVLDDGPSAIGIASTVVDATQNEIRIIREGSISNVMIQAVL